MTTIEIPMDGVAAARFQLMRELGHVPGTLSEYAMETLLTKLAEAVQPGAPAPTKASLAELAKTAARIAHEKAGMQDACDCGHAWSDHAAHIGCFECPCPAGGPHVVQLGPVVHRVGDEVAVTCRTSRYFGRVGLALAREGRGLRVELYGTRECPHFEQSELGQVVGSVVAVRQSSRGN